MPLINEFLRFTFSERETVLIVSMLIPNVELTSNVDNPLLLLIYDTHLALDNDFGLTLTFFFAFDHLLLLSLGPSLSRPNSLLLGLAIPLPFSTPNSSNSTNNRLTSMPLTQQAGFASLLTYNACQDLF